jgi:glycerol kinase
LASVLRSDGARVERALEGTVNGGGAALDWLAAREAIAVSELLDELRRSDISRLVPPIFLNGVSGLGSPYWVSDFQSGFLGDGNRAERTLAVLESVAYLIAVNLAEIRSVTSPLQRVLVTGGMSVNDAFCATLAAVCALPVERHAACEATARGLAGLLGATTTGTSAGECRTFQPDSVSIAAGGAAPGVASRYQRWTSAMHAAIH